MTFAETEGVETLGGYLMDAFGRIPSVGERLERDGARFTIEAVVDQRITSVRVENISGASDVQSGEEHR
jgi:CBS domain containing-hemolysin-like protein